VTSSAGSVEHPSYTAELVRAEPARSVRKAAGRVSRSRLLDGILGFLSVPYAVLCVVLMIVGMLPLLPFFLLVIRRNKAANPSTEGGGSLTAVKTLNGRAVAAASGFGPDTLAPGFISRLSLGGEAPGGWLFTQFYWRSQVLGFKLTRRLWLEQLMSLVSARISETTFLQIRTCWLDDVVTRFVSDLEGRPGQLVILGAGYDSRCHRLDLPESVARFEVDAAGTQGRKRALLDETGEGREGTRFVTCDFSRESWLEKLVAAGFDEAVPTCLVWEGVTPYLEEAVVRQTLAEARSLPAGSVIGFDVLDRDWALSPKMQKMTGSSGEPWLFGLPAGEERAWIEGQGLAVLDDLRYQELLARYMPDDSRGRTLGACGDFGCFLLAGVR
jgi:methyltransferase (TIGR00027 family)